MIVPSSEAKARIIAFYLPQFHPIPENDEWWEKGFTEWTNVGKAKPLYPGHYQPKLPTELGYYDLRVPETRKAQADLAREYGIEGFCYWHYWFGNGKMLLERPFEEVLKSGDPDFPFCLAWANESWRGFNHGLKKKEALIEQVYPGEEDDRAHFEYVLQAFRDKRYITVDGKPLFVIYQPNNNEKAIETKMKLWRKLAEEAGLPGIYFVGVSFFPDKEIEKFEKMGFDAVNVTRFFEFPKHHSFLNHRLNDLSKICKVPKLIPYAKLYPHLIGEEEKEENIIPTLFPNWDHTPRTGRRGNVFAGATPERFEKHVAHCMEVLKDKTPEHRIAFVKSWNEWAEGNYLEPDRKFGRGFLEAIKKNVL